MARNRWDLNKRKGTVEHGGKTRDKVTVRTEREERSTKGSRFLSYETQMEGEERKKRESWGSFLAGVKRVGSPIQYHKSARRPRQTSWGVSKPEKNIGEERGKRESVSGRRTRRSA